MFAKESEELEETRTKRFNLAFQGTGTRQRLVNALPIAQVGFTMAPPLKSIAQII
jgi:hypothetical protein